MTISEVKAFAENQDSKMLEAVVASLFLRGYETGDPSRLSLLFDRIYGKVKETHEHQIVGSVQSQILDTIIQIEKDNQNGGLNGKTSEETNEESVFQETTEEINSSDDT